MFVRGGVNCCRWPWGKHYFDDPILETYTQTVKDINGNEVQIPLTRSRFRSKDMKQMEADDDMKLIIKVVAAITIIITIITLMGLVVHYNWKIQQMKKIGVM